MPRLWLWCPLPLLTHADTALRSSPHHAQLLPLYQLTITTNTTPPPSSLPSPKAQAPALSLDVVVPTTVALKAGAEMRLFRFGGWVGGYLPDDCFHVLPAC